MIPPSRPALLAACAILLASAIIRFTAGSAFRGAPLDEALYRDYAAALARTGFSGYAQVTQQYLEDQRDPRTITKLPPTRFLYVCTGSAAARVFAVDPLAALRGVSLAFSIAFVALAGIAAWRMLGPPIALGTMALAAASPLSIHMGAHALIDGFFAFWATLGLWLLWENLREPRSPLRLAALAISLALMVMTKENAFFVCAALAGLVAVNRWAKFGVVTPQLIAAGIAGPLAGVLALAALAGGFAELVEIYRTLVTKAQSLGYAIATGDGPWFRYLFDLLTLDPLVLVIALTGVFTLPREKPAFLFLLGFVLFSYAIMCNVRHGMNLRYATIWLLPLCALAAAQLVALASRAGSRAIAAGVALFVAVGACELRQYRILFVENPVYELAPVSMLRALEILKTKPQ